MGQFTATRPVIGVAGATGAVGQQVMQQLAAQQIQTVRLDSASVGEPLAITAVICDDSALSPSAAAALIEQISLAFGEQRPIFDFAQPGDLEQIWGALNDGVMGGVSQSSIRFSDGLAYFSGQVSTANSGGFASVRTRNLPPADLSGYAGVLLRVKGDGQRYKFMLRTETNWDGVAYCCSFDTVADQWLNLRIPFADLVPIFRAKTVPDQPLDPSRVCAWQLMLSKFEYDGALNPRFSAGNFQLQVASIQAYRQPQPDRVQFVLIEPHPEPLQQLATSGLSYRLIQSSHASQANAADLAAFSIAALKLP